MFHRHAAAMFPVAALLLALAPAGAQAKQSNALNLYTQQDGRAIAVRNWSSHKIVEAQVQTRPDGHVWHVAPGGIPRNEAQEITVPARDCIANVRVKLETGRVLQMTGLHDCKDNLIAVRDNQIFIPRLAIPGAQQHGTPG